MTSQNNDWKKNYLESAPPQKKPTVRFHKEELDYVANQVVTHNTAIPGGCYMGKMRFLREHMLDNAYELLTREDTDYIETFGYGVKKSCVWDENPIGDHIVEFYVQPCFIREHTFADYDGDRIL